ncbi:flagellar hook-associated protein FlgL [Clostridium hydrogeniformans]|uniref:flagellar hook-associated protein FlgL n=1 Tax=Clostridium hydrogeniformans TaxID=349933 RepID=UPI00048442ED|nr:flagellar hook-associated protein FlgL [Clostridium hydrogeniformans]
MRVTNKMLSTNFLRDMRNNLGNMKDLQSQLTSGKEIRRPSDNPFKVARSMQLYSDIGSNKQYNENIKDTLNWLDTTDTALDKAGNTLQRVRDLLVSSGNPGYGEGEKKALKDEINQKVGELAQILNTNFDGRYIFGGTKGTSKPVEALQDDKGNTHIVYKTKDGNYLNKNGAQIELENGKIKVDANGKPIDNGDTKKYEDEFKHLNEDLIVEISQGVTMEYNVASRELMEFSKGKDLMDLLSDITSNLSSGKPEDIKKLTGENLDDITKAMDNLLKLRSEVGAKQNRMEAAKDQNSEENFNLTDILSKTEDIDFTEKIMEYSVMQSVYIASLQTSAKVIQPSLLDYLR